MKTTDILLGLTAGAVAMIVWRHYNPKSNPVQEAVRNILPEDTIVETTIFEKLDVKKMTPQRSLIPGSPPVLMPAVPDGPGLKPPSVYKPEPYVASPSGTLPMEVRYKSELVPTAISKPWLTNQ